VKERKNASDVSPVIPLATPFRSVSPILGTALFTPSVELDVPSVLPSRLPSSCSCSSYMGIVANGDEIKSLATHGGDATPAA
jgi:hypothetical protein